MEKVMIEAAPAAVPRSKTGFGHLATWYLLVVGIVVLTFGVLLRVAWFPPGPNLVCNRAFDGCIEQWRLENKTNGFPNVRGESRASLAVLAQYWGPNEFSDYRFVPGLQPDDPPQLLLQYVREPARRRYHGEIWSPFRSQHWIVLNLGMSGPYEFADALTTAEFKQRLSATLNFLETNQRPYWTNVVREHREFLASLRD